jgi:hypothetical protein
MIGAGLGSTGTPAGAVCAPRRSSKRPARARRAAAASSQGGRESCCAFDLDADCSFWATATAGIGPVARTSGRAIGWALERPEMESGATTVATTGWAGRRRVALCFVETARAVGCGVAGAPFSPTRLTCLARRGEFAPDGTAAGARPWSASDGGDVASSADCPAIEGGCGSGAGASGAGGGAGTADVSRGGSSVIGSM